MKNLYQLTNEIKDLNECLKENTTLLRANIGLNNVSRQIELMHARTQIMTSIAHRQAQVIRSYEDAMMSNVLPLNRKAA